MAYDTDTLYERALEEIEKNNLFFFQDVYAYLGISHDSFYRFFPTESERYETIKERLDKNKMKTKVSIRSKLHKSTSPAGLLALYKLLATNDERRALSMEYREHSGEMKLTAPKFLKDGYSGDE
jgi:hypothetical protein